MMNRAPNIGLMRVPAPYLLSLADLLLDQRGVPDGDGKVYADPAFDLRRSAGGDLDVVRKADADRRTDKVVASRRGSAETSNGEHVLVAGHVEDRVARCFPGPRAFTFAVGGEGHPRGVRHVVGEDLRDAKTWILDAEPGLPLLGLVAVRTEAALAEEAPGAEARLGARLAAARRRAALIEAARVSPVEVYTVSWRDSSLGPNGGTWTARSVRALSLGDAEAGFRALKGIPADARIVRVEARTLLEFLEAGGDPEDTEAAPGAAAFEAA